MAPLSKTGLVVKMFGKLALKWLSEIQTLSWRYSQPVSTPVTLVQSSAEEFKYSLAVENLSAAGGDAYHFFL